LTFEVIEVKFRSVDLEIRTPCWALVAHACNPNYSGGRDQEDHSLKQPRQIVHETLSRKYLTQKGLVEWLEV
jgi:hypothetical protein